MTLCAMATAVLSIVLMMPQLVGIGYEWGRRTDGRGALTCRVFGHDWVPGRAAGDALVCAWCGAANTDEAEN